MTTGPYKLYYRLLIAISPQVKHLAPGVEMAGLLAEQHEGGVPAVPARASASGIPPIPATGDLLGRIPKNYEPEPVSFVYSLSQLSVLIS